MKKYYWAGLIFCAQLSYAGLFEDEEARKKLNSIQDQLNNIQGNIQSNIDAKVTQALKNQNPLKIQNALTQMQDRLDKLRGEIEVLQFQLNNSQEREKILYQDIDDRITTLENNPQTAPSKTKEFVDQSMPPSTNIEAVQNDIIDEPNPAVEESPIATEVPPLIDKNIEVAAYDEANALLRATKYQEAFIAFDRFISAYPKAEKIAEAKYYLGYAQFALKNYNAAIKTYSKVIELHAESAIVPESMYGIANCEIQLAKIGNAKKTLRDLMQRFPNAEIIPKAKTRLKALESINL